MSARSFSHLLTTPDGLARALAAARADVNTPSGGLVFVSGALTQELDRVAEQVRGAWRNVPACVVPAAGVLTERGETEGASAAAGVLWSGGRTTPFALGESASARDLGAVLSPSERSTTPPPSGKPPSSSRKATALLFARSDVAGDALEGITTGSSSTTVFGAGTVGGAAISIAPGGDLLRGRAAGLLLEGLASPLVQASAACKLVTPFLPVEEVAGGMVLRVGGSAALDLLSSSMPESRSAASGTGAPTPQPLVFAALAEPPAPGEPAPPQAGGDAAPERWVVRAVRGVDPGRRGVLIGHDVVRGARLAFAVRDAAAARSGLEAAARALSQQALGAAPRFALFLSCAGRGQGLYGAADVESRILRQRFGDLPIAGMHSAFELVPWGPGEARLALYTGVFALFRSPS